MQCSFCNNDTDALPSMDAVIDAGWIPSYWEGDTETANPVCPDCASVHLQYNPTHGDYELRPTVPDDSMPILARLLATPLTLGE